MESQSEKKQVATTSGKNFIKRELNGSTFLTLEHVGHMVLIVLVPMLVLAGLYTAFSMWTGSAGVMNMFMSSPMLSGAGVKAIEAVMALGVVAALVVLAPLLVLLDRRTRAEWRKRPGYAGRLAYKVPVYSALAVLVTMIVAAKIQLLYVILASLAFIGVPNAPIGAMYLTHFLPAVAVIVVAGGSAWYLFKLAKGHDTGRMFSMGMASFSAIVVLALFITSIAVLHSNDSSFMPTATQESPSKSDYYQDMLDSYYR